MTDSPTSQAMHLAMTELKEREQRIAELEDVLRRVLIALGSVEKYINGAAMNSEICRYFDATDAALSVLNKETCATSSQQLNRNFPADNGQYMHRCCRCNEIFHGHKRRVVCAICDATRSDQPKGGD